MTVSGSAAGAPRLRLRLRRDMIAKEATIHNGRSVAAVGLGHGRNLKLRLGPDGHRKRPLSAPCDHQPWGHVVYTAAHSRTTPP